MFVPGSIPNIIRSSFNAIIFSSKLSNNFLFLFLNWIKFVLKFSMIAIFSLLCFFYFRMMFLYRKSWISISVPTVVNTVDTVSVVVACRNEEENILNLIENIKSQNFDIERFELIIVNDHSTDSTTLLLQQESENWDKLKVINLEDSISGKKNAIRKGTKFAKGEIIICTDADCRIEENWISTIVNYFSEKNIKFVSAPVVYQSGKSFFSKYQSLEMLSLVSSSASAINRSKATLCNGANLAFRKKEYLSIPEQEFDNFKTDDVALLHYFKKNFKNSISFVKQKQAIVTTSMSVNLLSYLSQKMRWISASKWVKDTDTILVSLLVYGLNLLIVIPVIFLLFMITVRNYGDYSELVYVFRNFIFIFLVLVVFFKFLSDYFFLKSVLTFFKRNDLLIYLFLFQIVNAVFTVVIVPLSFLIPVKWKDRKL